MRSQGPRDGARGLAWEGLPCASQDGQQDVGRKGGEEIDAGSPAGGDTEPPVEEAGGDRGKSWSRREGSPAHTDPFCSRLGDGRG